MFSKLLYLIEILHQTTTTTALPLRTAELYLIEILHQTTTKRVANSLDRALYLIEILHQTTTAPLTFFPVVPLYLIEILHQTTTSRILERLGQGCILSKFYIKPQLYESASMDYSVVSYRNSTSNHNFANSAHCMAALYLIEILHQTTTALQDEGHAPSLYLIEILHQTTTTFDEEGENRGCILSKFYIKPQPLLFNCQTLYVVSYRNSTSNHNVGPHID